MTLLMNQLTFIAGGNQRLLYADFKRYYKSN